MGTDTRAGRWLVDTEPSRRWPLYSRGNVGEVLPEVMNPFLFEVSLRAAERGWREAYADFGLVAPGDFGAEEWVVIGVFGGYTYINASYIRMLGVRAPGATVEAIDAQFFGESDAPPYRPRPGDRHWPATLRLGRTVLRALRTTALPALDADRAAAERFVAGRPAADAPNEALFAYIRSYPPLFQALFRRHALTTFLASLLAGLLADLCAKAGLAEHHIALLGGIGDVESAAPARALWELGRLAAAVPDVDAAFDDGVKGVGDRLAALPEAAEFNRGFGRFLEEFGFRGPDEWNFAADTWELRPELAYAVIDRLRRADPAHDPSLGQRRLEAARTKAAAEVRSRLRAPDRFVFDRALRSAAVHARGRERQKTTLILAQHEVRKAQRELARRAAARGGIDDLAATCLLTLGELEEYVADPAVHLVTLEERRRHYERLRSLVPPFLFEGEPPPVETWASRGRSAEPLAGGSRLQGIAGCGGTARGRARVVTDPGDPRGLGAGDVLVAPMTDPSWTPLFLAAAAVVVDVGAVVSHAVIASRELGIPCVVSVTDATRRIPDGSLVEVDGDRGTVTVIEEGS